jgi:hypothetical protein
MKGRKVKRAASELTDIFWLGSIYGGAEGSEGLSFTSRARLSRPSGEGGVRLLWIPAAQPRVL